MKRSLLIWGLLWSVVAVRSGWAEEAQPVAPAKAPAAPAAKTTAAEAQVGPLEAYVNKKDESYTWSKRREVELLGGKLVELALTSQTWRDIVWRHQVFIYVPPEVRLKSRAIFMIAGGGWKDELAGPVTPENGKLPREATLIATLANQMQTPMAVIMQVPFQPIFNGKVEDQIISYTFQQFFLTGDTSWPLLCPMVKAAVRGMDAVQECCAKDLSLKIEKFTVTGASKRGWTTWLTGAVDPRADAIAPMVIDMLNMAPQMEHQLATWGEFSEQIADYTRLGLQRYLFSGAGKKLREIVDPYSYRQRLKQPKLIFLGTNDRYWPLDALNLYWNDLEGDKHICYCPNNPHGLKDLPRIVGCINALHCQAGGELKLPRMSWDLREEEQRCVLSVKADKEPKSVSAWIASAETRDFRNAKWEPRPTKNGDGAYTFELPRPQAGYAAVFGEAVFEAGAIPYYLSTNVKIIAAPGAPKPEVKKLEPAESK